MLCELTPADVLGTVFDIGDTGFEAVKTSKGWQGRRRPEGFRRMALLTPPCETPAQVVLSLRMLRHLR